MKKRIRKIFLFLCSFIWLISSCQSIPTKPEATLWGTWHAEEESANTGPLSKTLTFYEDGRLILNEDEADPSQYVVISPGRMKVTVDGETSVVNYEYADDRLTFIFPESERSYQRIGALPIATAVLTQQPEIKPDASPTRANIIEAFIEEVFQGENQVITPENAGRLIELNQIGKGVLGRMIWSPAGDRFALSTSTGVYLYEGAHFQNEMFLEMDSLLNDVAFLQDGKTLAVVSLNGSVRVWDLDTYSENQAFNLHPEKMVFAAYSSPQDRLFVNGWPASFVTYEYKGEVYDVYEVPMEDGTVMVLALVVKGRQESQFVDPDILEEGLITWQGPWRELNRQWVLNTHSPTSLSQIQPDINKFASAFSLDDRFLATWGRGNIVQVWSLENGEELSRLNTENLSSLSMVFSPDGRFLAIGSGDGSLLLWEFTTGRVVFDVQAHTEAIHAIAFSQDGAYLASGGEDQQILLWDVNTGQVLQTFEGHQGNVSCLAFSPDGSQLISGSYDGTIRFWDLNTGKAISTQAGHSEHIEALGFTPDGHILAAGKDEQDTVYLWEMGDREQLRKIEGFSDWVNSMDFSPTEENLATGGKDGIIRIWDLSTEKLLRLFTVNERAYSLSFSPDGEKLALGSGIWDATTGTLLREHLWSKTPWLDVGYSPEGTHLISCGSGRCLLWNADNRGGLVIDENYAGDFSPDGKMLSLGGTDGNIRVMKTESWQLIKEFVGHSESVCCIAFSPDGAWLLSGDVGGEIRFWDVNQNFQGKNNENLPDQILRSVFSPSGSLIASYNANGSIIVWDAETGAILKEINESDHASHIFAFSPDGYILAVSGADGVVRMWRIP
jgi:WD40 repeat protein